MTCVRCGEPTRNDEYFELRNGEYLYIHIHCAVEGGKTMINSGLVDNVDMTVSLPDGTTTTMNGRELREMLSRDESELQ
jgi:hypothetical protein